MNAQCRAVRALLTCCAASVLVTGCGSKKVDADGVARAVAAHVRPNDDAQADREISDISCAPDEITDHEWVCDIAVNVEGDSIGFTEPWHVRLDGDGCWKGAFVFDDEPFLAIDDGCIE